MIARVAIAYGRASDASNATVCVAANTRTVNRAASRLIKVRAEPIEQDRGHAAAISEGRRRTTSERPPTFRAAQTIR